MTNTTEKKYNVSLTTIRAELAKFIAMPKAEQTAEIAGSRDWNPATGTIYNGINAENMIVWRHLMGFKSRDWYTASYLKKTGQKWAGKGFPLVYNTPYLNHGEDGKFHRHAWGDEMMRNLGITNEAQLYAKGGFCKADFVGYVWNGDQIADHKESKATEVYDAEFTVNSMADHVKKMLTKHERQPKEVKPDVFDAEVVEVKVEEKPKASPSSPTKKADRKARRASVKKARAARVEQTALAF